MASQPHPLAMSHTQGSRRSKWLVVDALGVKSIVQVDKRTLIQLYDLHIPIRDMRWLDPNLTSTNRGNIAVRDAAIVFAIDYVQVIITAERAILPQNALGRPEHTDFLEKVLSTVQEAAAARRKLDEKGEEAASLETDSLANSFNPDLPYQPFELVVLEVALKEVCSSYGTKAKQLEAMVNPACDALLKKVQTRTLENLRRLKTRHQRLLSAVTTARDELEGFLKDDDDIAKMCLTRKLEQSRPDTNGETPSGAGSLGRSLRRSLTSGRTGSGSSPPSRQLQRDDSSGRRSPGAQAEFDAEADAEAMEEVENLLESYFIQIDRSYNRLASLGEYVGDTEEFINIDLDSSQNRLFRLDIVLTAAAFSLEILHVLAGILGENVVIPPAITKTISQFWAVNFTTLLICIAVFSAIYSWLRYKRLLLG